jgi:hypothetical protein
MPVAFLGRHVLAILTEVEPTLLPQQASDGTGGGLSKLKSEIIWFTLVMGAVETVWSA